MPERCGTIEFTWTDKHFTPEELLPLRPQTDGLAVDAVSRLQAFSAKSKQSNTGQCFSRFDMYSVSKEHREEDSGTEVLVRTGGFSLRVMPGRFLETFLWLLQVTMDLKSIKPGGEGHTSTVRPRPQEPEDFLALFRYIAYVMATPDSFFDGTEQSKVTMESIMMCEPEPTESSKSIGANFVAAVQDYPGINVSKPMIEVDCRVLSGDELGDKMGFSQPAVVPNL
ncbi:hypothetical protein N7471_008051 [Penicillium samsonianum]|uniref:uncharacterized protein n=1 Tax=Penicillium samsonianum TaxID=1882272 RepID=UPI002546740A|nr:uncharacterized protein N7471_008051 [Penicillium samsonianum]KAJ6132836.1 hypothetical protein N7471_008051 [Penicillium samsonianum]